MARRTRKPTRSERRWQHLQWQLQAAPSGRDRLWAACQYLRAVLADAEFLDEAERTADRMAQQLQEAARTIRTKETRR